MCLQMAADVSAHAGGSQPSGIQRISEQLFATFFRQCCGSGVFIPDSNFFHHWSRVKKISDPGSASNNLSILTPKNVSKLSEIWSGMFIPGPDLGSCFFTHSGSGVKKAQDPGSATLILDDSKTFVAKEKNSMLFLKKSATKNLPLITWLHTHLLFTWKERNMKLLSVNRLVIK